MIPKKIHYCWFGGNPLPELAQKCLASWQKFCPDYEIIQWNEENFNLEEIPYIQQAYQAKKWAFVSDYARFKILYDEGGVYLDTDVELIRPLDDLLEAGGFMASESKDCQVATGLGIAAPKGLPLYQEILEDYKASSFLKEDGTCDLTTVVERITRILDGHGLEHVDKLQKVAGIVIYPKEYFCPLDYHTRKIRCTQNTYAIHYYADSWKDKPVSTKGKIYRLIYRVFGERTALFVKKLLSK